MRIIVLIRGSLFCWLPGDIRGQVAGSLRRLGGRPQLKRDPLGGCHARDTTPVYIPRSGRDASRSLGGGIRRAAL